jgi:hypothetical protein
VGGGAARSSGGVKPRFGNKLLPAREIAGCDGNDENEEVPLFGSVLAKLPERSVPVLLVRLLKLKDALVGVPLPAPMRSGMASIANAAKEQAPATRATKGDHRQLSTLGSPISRIREQA